MTEVFEHALAAFEGMGVAGYALFAVVYVLGALLLLPEAILTMLAGALLGTLWGSLFAWACALAGSFAAFLIARLALRERIEKRVEKSKWLRAVNRALPKEGWKVVALARLSPLVPFGLQNYLFGVTKVRRRDYLVATALAIIPGTVVYAFIGATGRALLAGGSALKWTMLAVGILATIILSVLLGRIAKKRLNIA
jgi:uncharacterized membrane protein YdjX (TVP38/TMEM64 family)